MENATSKFIGWCGLKYNPEKMSTTLVLDFSEIIGTRALLRRQQKDVLTLDLRNWELQELLEEQ
jgi:hypothetical protein